MTHRVRVHLAMRAGVRLWQLAAPRRLAGSRPFLRALAGTAADLVTWRWMTDHDGFGWGRVLVDSAEAALWAAAAPPTADGSRPAVLPSVSLSLEAGVRKGPGGLFVPAAIGVAVASTRKLKHEPLRLTQLAWPVGGVAGGWLLARYEQWRRGEVVRDVQQRAAARAAAAFRAGQLSVAAEGDSIIDEVQRACVLAQDHGGLALRAEVGAWKASLADAARDEAVFLAESLSGWQSLRNLDHDLGRAVRFDVKSGPMTLLSRRQSQILWARLDGLELAGAVPVDVLRAEGHRGAGSALRVRIGPTALVLDADPCPRRTVDVLPPQLVLSAVLLATQVIPDLGDVNPVIVGVATSSMVGTALWAHHHLPSDDPHVRPRLATLAFAITLPYTIAATLTQDTLLTRAGTPIFPVGGAAQALGVVTAATYSSMSARQRKVALAQYGGLILVGWLISPNRRHWRDLLANFAWTMASSGISSGLHGAIDSSVADLVDKLEMGQDRIVEQAAQHGREWVRDYVHRVVGAATRRLADIGDQLPEDVRAEATRRVDALHMRLASEGR